MFYVKIIRIVIFASIFKLTAACGISDDKSDDNDSSVSCEGPKESPVTTQAQNEKILRRFIKSDVYASGKTKPSHLKWSLSEEDGKFKLKVDTTSYFVFFAFDSDEAWSGRGHGSIMLAPDDDQIFGSFTAYRYGFKKAASKERCYTDAIKFDIYPLESDDLEEKETVNERYPLPGLK